MPGATDMIRYGGQQIGAQSTKGVRMKLTPHPELPQLSIIHVPFTRTKFGALHELDVSELAGALMVSEMFDLTMRYQEINRFRSVVPPRSFSLPIAILPGVGHWHAVVGCSGEEPVSLKARPIEGLLIPAGCLVGLQSLDRNRTMYTVLAHKSCRVEKVVDPDDPAFLPNWERSDIDPAYNEITGEKLPA